MCPISVSGKNRNWECLNRKISQGISLEDAAIECGIPLNEAVAYISDRMTAVDTLNFELRLIGQNAIKNALTKLTELSQGKQRISSISNAGDNRGRKIQALTSDDLDAAKALAKFGLDALKFSRSTMPSQDNSQEKDIFDSTRDPWKLKKIE